MLALTGVHAYYGDSHILHDVSLEVGRGEVVSLLGRNGAGKTTTALAVMGYLAPRPGSIVFEGRPIGGWAPHRVSRAGIGFVPQERGIFPSLTVKENLTVAARPGERGRWTLDAVYALFPRLREREAKVATWGDFGRSERRQLAAIRVLMEGHWQVDGGGRPCYCGEDWPCPVLERAAEALRGRKE